MSVILPDNDRHASRERFDWGGFAIILAVLLTFWAALWVCTP